MMRKLFPMLLLSVGFVWAIDKPAKDILKDEVPTSNEVVEPGERVYFLGDQVGTTEYDYPRNANYKFIVSYPAGNSIHITYMRRVTGVQDTRSMFYNYYDPAVGAWLDNVGVDAMDYANNGYNGFGGISILGDGRTVITSHLNEFNLVGKYAVEDAYLSGAFTQNDMPAVPPNDLCRSPDLFFAGTNWVALCHDNTDTLYVLTSADGAAWDTVLKAPDIMWIERWMYDYNPQANVAVVAYFEATTDASNNPYIWWGSPAIKYIVSTDGGQTWSDPQVVKEEVDLTTIFDGEMPIDTFSGSETDPVCTPFFRADVAVTGDGTVHLVWEDLCFDGTYLVDTTVDTTVTPPETTYIPVFVEYPQISYYNSATGQIEAVTSIDHSGDNELTYWDQSSLIKPKFYQPKLIRRNGFNDVFVVYLNHEGDQDPITGIYMPEIYLASKYSGTWTNVNITNTPSECELWVDAAKEANGSTAYIMYYGDSNECGTAILGEGGLAVSNWYVFSYDLTTAFDEKAVVSGFNYNPVTKTIVFNTAYAGDVNIYAVDGRLISTKKAVNGIVRLSDLSTGIYVVKAGSTLARSL